MSSPATYQDYLSSDGSLDSYGGLWHCEIGSNNRCTGEKREDCNNGLCIVGFLYDTNLQVYTMSVSTGLVLNHTEYPVGSVNSYSWSFNARLIVYNAPATSTSLQSALTSTTMTSSLVDSLSARSFEPKRQIGSDLFLTSIIAGQNFTEPGITFGASGAPDAKISRTGNVTIPDGMLTIGVNAQYSLADAKYKTIIIRFHDLHFKLGTSNDTTPVATDTPSKKVNLGAILGPIVGSIFLLAIITFLLRWYFHKRNSKPRGQGSQPIFNGISLYYGGKIIAENDSLESRPFLSSTLSSSLTGGPPTTDHSMPAIALQELEPPPNYQAPFLSPAISLTAHDALSHFAEKHRDLILPELERKLRRAGYNPKRGPEIISPDMWWQRHGVSQLELADLKEAYERDNRVIKSESDVICGSGAVGSSWHSQS